MFRGIPLLAYTVLVKKWPRSMRSGQWCYYLAPAIAFAAYHVPGHGHARIADTFVLSLTSSWLALHHGFCSVMVLHYVFDALMVLSLGTLKNIPRDEVRWLADHAAILNSSFSIAVLAMVALMFVLFVRQLWKAGTKGSGTVQ